MFRCARRNLAAGFYIATHPWLEREGYCKFGFSSDLSARLHSTSYTTCFSDEWQYSGAVECTARQGRMLEQLMLFAFADKRLGNKELVKTDTAEALRVASRIARRVLKLRKLKKRSFPTYHKKKREKEKNEKDLQVALPPSDRKKLKALQQLVTERADELFDRSSVDAAASDATGGEFEKVEETLKDNCSALTTQACTPNASAEITMGADVDEVEDLVDVLPSLPLVPVAFSPVKLRDYQDSAVDRAMQELASTGKAILQMACRSGKTPVAYEVMQRYLREHQGVCHILFLVPGLSLLRQTVHKLRGYGLHHDIKILMIGSDPTILSTSNDEHLTMTTSPQEIEHFLDTHPRSIIVSTYMSSAQVIHLPNHRYRPFALTIFDEAHRVCGSSEPSPFNSVLLAPPSGDRLFMTATPTYDTPITMDTRNLFGGVAFRFYLREGINRDVVNDFQLSLLMYHDDSVAMPIYEAMGSVDKLLVFCRSIAEAETLCAEVSAIARKHNDPVECMFAHSRLGPQAVNNALQCFRSLQRAVLFNVRLFQEGVEIPDLNAVLFAAPRYSPRDIIQSIYRPLNKLPGKPTSTVFLPVRYDPSKKPEDPVNMGNFSTIVPFTDALMDEDPALFEYLIDPSKRNYNIKIVGSRSLRTNNLDLQRVVLPWVRRGIRFSAKDTDRLMRAERLPWKSAFEELRRVVVECHRYPKLNDAWIVGDTHIRMLPFLQYCRKGYALHISNDPFAYLEPHQIHDLESLPHWKTYGLSGPYPWKECLKTMSDYLEKHRRLPPLEIHRGGYIGLDATPFERLSGVLCNVNQQDRIDRCAVAPAKQKELDELFAKYGLRWRKLRDNNGQITENDKTCITECYNEFKVKYDSGDAEFRKYVDFHFPGYPEKHKRMESLHVQQSGTAPPRAKLRSASQIKRMRAKGAVGNIAESIVVCRVCRLEVDSDKWSEHLVSGPHLTAVASLAKGQQQ